MHFVADVKCIFRILSAAHIHAQLLARRIGASVSPSTHHFDERLWTRPRVVRLSPSYFNTEEEVATVVAAVREICESVR